MHPLPTNPHDWALWLHESLDGAHHVGNGLWQGTLPAQWDFEQIREQVDAQQSLGGVHDAQSRRIEFHPANVQVYQTTDQFFANQYHRRRVPRQFTIRELGYTHGRTAQSPALIANYLAAAKLFELLSRLADLTGGDGASLHFIKSHDAKIELVPDYGQTDLAALPSLGHFEDNYVITNHHAEQKRCIVRSALLEVFKGRRRVALSDVLARFEEIMDNVRSSYSMYMAEFSFEKVRAEIEKDNLDSTLKLNKTFSEIQNQLLALPVALVLVGGQMAQADGLSLKNVVIWLGSALFSGLMWMLIHNQRNAVRAIGDEIRLRRHKIDTQPSDVSSRFKRSFDDLEQRQDKQDGLLGVLVWVVLGSLLFSTAILVWYSYRDEVLVLAARVLAVIEHVKAWLLTALETHN
jgi:hypothetical protein